jgi:hypothetical protein
MNLPTLGRPDVSRLSYSAREVGAIRLGGFAGLVAGALMVAHFVADAVLGGRTTDGPRALLHTAWLAALFLLVRGVRVLQRPASDRVTEILLRVALTGVGAMVVAAAVEAVSLFTGSHQDQGDPPTPILVVLIGLVVLLVVGLLAFAVAVLRAGVLPRSAGLLVLAGVLTKMLAPEPVPSLAILGLTVAWLGVAVLRRLRSDVVA